MHMLHTCGCMSTFIHTYHIYVIHLSVLRIHNKNPIDWVA